MIVTVKLPNSMDAVRITALPAELAADVDICRYKEIEGHRLPLAQLRELRLGLNIVIESLEQSEREQSEARI